ncbi:MAG: hypothetical protein EBV59_09035 [Synechococcaceae bacterium WB7_1C_051]|nr:hypothetical protein [Synechococcaceae bacterium WB7_1C_051]
MNNMMKIIFSFSLLLIFLLGCKKPLIDYRSKFVGEYQVISYNSSWVGSNYQQDTVTYTLNVNRSNDRYYVDFVRQNSSVTKTYLLETDGTLHSDGYDPHFYVNGGFVDKNHFRLTGGYMGLGGGYSFDEYGTKK